MTFPPIIYIVFYKYYTSSGAQNNARPRSRTGVKLLSYKIVLFKTVDYLGIGHILAVIESVLNIGKTKCA